MAAPKTAHQLFESLSWDDMLRAALLLLAGLIVARLYQRVVRRGLLNHLPRFGQQLGGWIILGLFAAAALHQLGFNIGVLLGAAGVLSVALGFAAQTSAANIISGLFVVSERSFQIGDVIQVGSNTGEVLSVDMLSVKLRTPDNRYVRIPNETIVKSDVVNLSKFPIRRADLKISIAYDAPIALAREVLLKVATDNPICLEEPRPVITLEGFGESSVDIQFSVWAARENFGDLRTTIQEQVKLAFDTAGIEFPYPHRTIYLKAEADAAAKPPIAAVEKSDASTQDNQDV
jgi:small-conductance mechanosensitive channel